MKRDCPKAQSYSTKRREKRRPGDRCGSSNMGLLGIPEETENESGYLKIEEENDPK